MAEIQKLLICSDLDRTIIPNGDREESTPCRPVLRRLAAHSAIHLAYVSGRDKQLILGAIEEYYLPRPDHAIGDVGTTLYRISDGDWQICDDWSHEIAIDWQGLSWEGLNGNYAAGVLEGLVHFIPETEKLVAAAAQNLSSTFNGNSSNRSS